jgi:double-stranded uracil-DNA glycosylase
MRMLPDLLQNNLDIVICGSAAGKRSAEVKQYYAGRGNKFWDVLHSVGLTAEKLDPSRFRELVKYGIGLTDVVKDQSGMDHEIDFSNASESDLCSKIKRYKPKVLCFNGKNPAKVYFKVRNVKFGIHTQKFSDTVCFIAPSTSGAANKTWDIKIWEQLYNLVRT